jgi:uncharacterized protein YyaL (SSP411 family)
MESDAAVRWNGWEPGALARAASEGKLIFLDIDATWCQGCRLLDRTSLVDPRVVRMLNEDFISVRVDADRRPDINERYNQGGWPTTAVLFPDGKLLTGATYLPPDALAAVLGKCRDFYRKDRARVDEYLRQGSKGGEDPGAARNAAAAVPGTEDLPRVKRAVLAMYDPVHPGFFHEPKFPVTDLLAFLRDAWCVEGDAEAGDILLRVLRTMRSSDVFDPVEGGFFRYAARRDWTDPHYEKVLPDNAELLALYAAAYGKTRETRFAEAGRDILRFLFGRLYDSGTGAFFGSQGADEAYYRLPAAERSLRIPPPVDRTVFSEYNGRMASALVAAHRAFGPPEGGDAAGDSLLARAERLAGFLHRDLWRGEKGQARYLAPPGAADVPPHGLLSDHAAVATAHLDLFDATGREELLRRAEVALSFLVAHLYRDAAAGFVDRRPSAGDFGGLSTPVFPFAPNAQAVSALLRCARATGRDDLLAVGERALCGLSAESEGRGAFAAPYGSALLEFMRGRNAAG